MKMKEFIQNIALLIILMAAPIIVSSQITFQEHPVASGYNSWCACIVDMDEDGDMDFVASARIGNKIAWFENDGFQNYTEHVVSNSATYAMGIDVSDLDGDGDIDIVAAIQASNRVDWWENDGDQNFTRKVVGDIVSPSLLRVGDMDGDNDPDIIVCACEDNSNKIVCFENNGKSIRYSQC